MPDLFSFRQTEGGRKLHLVVKCGPINWPFQGRSNETDLEQTQSTPLVDGVCCVATLVATRLEPKIFVHEFEWPWRQKWQKCRFFFGPFPVSRNFVFRRAENKKKILLLLSAFCFFFGTENELCDCGSLEITSFAALVPQRHSLVPQFGATFAKMARLAIHPVPITCQK